VPYLGFLTPGASNRIFLHLSQQLKNCWAQKINFFSFKIYILPPLGLCCTGRRHQSPQLSYSLTAFIFRVRQSKKNNWTSWTVRQEHSILRNIGQYLPVNTVHIPKALHHRVYMGVTDDNHVNFTIQGVFNSLGTKVGGIEVEGHSAVSFTWTRQPKTFLQLFIRPWKNLTIPIS
jgi:hypothetical protein